MTPGVQDPRPFQLERAREIWQQMNAGNQFDIQSGERFLENPFDQMAKECIPTNVIDELKQELSSSCNQLSTATIENFEVYVAGTLRKILDEKLETLEKAESKKSSDDDDSKKGGGNPAPVAATASRPKLRRKKNDEGGPECMGLS
jgi:hypothetical protein